VRRNGLRTLTVRSYSAPDVLPSVVLKAAQPQLDALPLPAGVRMEQGGEVEGSAEVQGAVNLALLVSMIGVYLILLFQFRNARQPLVVMVSIPLALVGAALGLVITHNPFTYTANLGVNALTGVVVRNAIILVDFANELRRQGMGVEAAALLAGRRRLRPIFLTTMAAALGVTPMILSGSPLWSPMASVIAVGLVVSMVFTLIVVPVLYAVVERRVERRAARRARRAAQAESYASQGVLAGSLAAAARAAGAVVLLAALAGHPATLAAQRASVASAAADAARATSVPRVLTLDDAIELALQRSTATRVAAARVEGAAAHRRGAAADFLPQLALTGNRIQGTATTTIVVPQGVLGNDASGAPLPSANRSFEQGAPAVTFGQLSLTQPVTQLYRIRQAEALASAQLRGAEAERAQAERDVALAAERLYVGALTAREHVRAAEAALVARRRQLADADRALEAGTVIRAQADGARASALDAEYAVVTARNEASDLEDELRDLLALSPDVPLALEAPPADTGALPPLDEYVRLALANSPDIATAAADAEQARRARALARADYIPDVGVGVSYLYQRGVPFVAENGAALTIQGSWKVWDFGKRAASVDERQAGVQVAQLALEHARDRATVEVEKAYRKAERASSAAAAARAALEARSGDTRVARDEQGRGLVAVAYRAGAEAELAAAEARVVEAELASRLARAELAHAAGVRP
jgi:outer membrane protein TolC